MSCIFYPDKDVNNVYELTEAFYQQNNIKGVIFDIDNTLVTHTTEKPTEEIFNYFKKLENMGIKIKRAVSAEIDLPSATKSGSYTISGFSKKLLDIYPAFKDEYKAHVAHYGSFLYLSFLGEHFVPQIKQTLLANDKKSVKKLIDFMSDCFNKGDRETVNAVVAVSAAAIYNDANLANNFFVGAENEKYYMEAVKNFLPVFPTNKKLVSLLIK